MRKTTIQLLKRKRGNGWNYLLMNGKRCRTEKLFSVEIFELEQTKKTMTEMLRKLEEEKRLLVAEKEQLATENAEVRCDRNLVLVTYCSFFSRKIKFHLVFSSLNRIFAGEFTILTLNPHYYGPITEDPIQDL